MAEIKTVLSNEKIAEIQTDTYQALVKKGYNGGMGGIQWDHAHARAIEAAVLSANAGKDAKDAARYRWLRHGDNDEEVLRAYDRGSQKGEFTMFLPRGEELDRKIDRAMPSQHNESE